MNFTTEERNRKEVKQIYYRRNIIWQCMARLIRAGHTKESAARAIYQIYGHKASVTQISGRILKDKKLYNGGYHPNLGL